MLDRGAHRVQLDFTEGGCPSSSIPVGVLRVHRAEQPGPRRFSADERARIGVHTCPGGDQDSTHSADVDYAALLPELFTLKAGNVYMLSPASPTRRRARLIAGTSPDERIFVGVIDPIDPRVETAEEVRDRVLEAAAPFPSIGSAPATTAASRRSPTTRRPPGHRLRQDRRPGQGHPLAAEHLGI